MGGPVLPPGKPTVFIGGMPAATVTSMCTCVGPPDMIIQGSSNVFIGGMPAARMGDRTAHGGVIVSGCMTVLIGDDGNDKKARYEARLALIMHGRQEAKDLAAKGQTDSANALKAAAERLERDNHAIERARLSSHVYTLWDKDGNRVSTGPGAPEGWSVKEGNAYFDKKTGFAYAIYESDFERPPKPVLVFRGTQTGTDWKTNGGQGMGKEDEQYKQSMDQAEKMKQTYGPNGFEIAGHSKAGGQTAAASIVTGAKGYGINSAGVHPNTVGRRGHTVEEGKRVGPDGRPILESYNFEHDPLNNMQDTAIPRLKKGLGYVPSPIVRNIGEWLTASQAGPQAAGQRYVLPAVDINGNPVPYRPTPGNMLAYHGPEMLIASMEHQKQVDAAMLMK